MNITRNNCQQVISSMLCSLPCGWKDAISNAICNAISSGGIGQSGYSGFSGNSGVGVDGASGVSGYSGYSGFSGQDGTAAFSGYSGFSGLGFSGYSGYSGDSGVSGYSGYSGYSGSNPGLSGYSGYSGSNPGLSGFSGFSGANPGSSGFSGYSGFSGAGGASGFSGVAAAITADNGLIMSVPTNVQLGSPVFNGAPLLHTSYIDHSNGDFQIVLNGGILNNSPLLYVHGGAQGILGQGTTTGVTGQANSIPLWGVNTTTTTTVAPGLVLNRSATTGGTGEGSSIQWNLQNSINGIAKAGDIVVKYSNGTAGSETAQMLLELANIGNASQAIVTIDGNGTATFLGPYSPTNTVRAINTTGTGVRSETTSGTGVWAITSGSGIGGQFNSTSGVSIAGIINPATTGIVETVAQFERHSSGTATNGIGGQLTLYNQNAAGTVSPSNQIEWIYTSVTAGAETSQMKFGGMLSNVPVTMMTLNGDGSWDITPISATAASAVTPSEGKLVFVNSTNGTFTSIGLWDFENGAWHKL